MKIMTPLLLAAALALPATAFAGDDYPKHKHSMIKKLDKIVDLTDTQKAQIAELRGPGKPPKHHKIMRNIVTLDPASASYQADLDAIANDAADQARERVYQLAERSQAIKALLSDEQLEKLTAYHAAKRDKQRDF